ncbi:MAG TPA: hypothetical protein VFZ65_11755, partial [Planctomycetota bacterium]|nr:hypothetical protein [Planctomycetota bacterium]
MLARPLAKRVVALARKFESRKPWQDFDDRHAFACELPGEPHRIHAVVLGAAGHEFGLALYTGDRGLDQLRLSSTDPRAPIVGKILLLTFDPTRSVAPEYLELTRAAGVTDSLSPVIVAVEGDRRGRPARNAELRLFAQVLEAFLLALDRDILRPSVFEPQRSCRMLTLAIAAEGGKVRDVTARFENVPAPAGSAGGPEPLPWPLPELSHIAAHWVVGVEPSPMDAEDTERWPDVLFVVDVATGHLEAMRAFVEPEAGGIDEAIHTFARTMAKANDGEGCLPQRLTFVHRGLFAALGKGLVDLGIEVDVVDEHPRIREVIDAFRARHGSLPGDGADAEQAARRRLADRVEEVMDGADVYSRKALARFFGDAETLDDLDGIAHDLADTAYREWYVVCHRGKAGRRTLAERLLAGDLPEPERRELQARIGARTGLYRVARVRPPLVALADVLSDYEVEIVDGQLANGSIEGSVLPGRIADAGGNPLLVLAGPPLAPARVERALGFLERECGELTSAELQRRPELLGRLWAWMGAEDEGAREGAGVRMVNTDGHAIRAQTGTFRVADWAAVAAALAARDDVDEDPEGRADGDGVEDVAVESWCWHEDARDMPGGMRLLAELERVGDELLVHLNSDERLARARTWLEAIPGVTFEGSRVEVPGSGARAGARRAREEKDVGPEDLAMLQEHFDAQCMRWLDEVVPALGNRTPRAAVRAAAGREQVLRLIRSWPDPIGVRGLRVPRERMR